MKVAAWTLLVLAGAGCKRSEKAENPPIGPGAPQEAGLRARARDTRCDGAACLPDMDFVTLDGAQLLRPQLGGKVVLVSFWASWCEPCTTEAGGLSGVYQRHQREGFELIGVSLDTADDATLKKFAAHYNLRFPIVRASDDILAAYGRPSAVPTTMLFDRAGQRVWSMSGVANDVIVEADVAALLRGETVKVTRTGTSPVHAMGDAGGGM